MEICKFYGRDINIMEMFGLFENILAKGEDSQNEKYSFTRDEVRIMFLQALRELKYMGYLS